MSAIIPRWCDFAISQQKVVLVNNMVKKLVLQSANCKFLRTYRRFIKGGSPVKNLYARDKLHLNRNGIVKLNQFFKQMLHNL